MFCLGGEEEILSGVFCKAEVVGVDNIAVDEEPRVGYCDEKEPQEIIIQKLSVFKSLLFGKG